VSALQRLGLLGFQTAKVEVVKSENKGIYEVVLSDEKGNIIPFSFDAALQEDMGVVSP
jgi:hypothetical protein